MKLRQLLNIIEDTTSGSVSTYNKPMSDSPLKRTGFLDYTADTKCNGCKILKKFGWPNQYAKKKQLKCAMCGAIHKKEKE